MTKVTKFHASNRIVRFLFVRPRHFSYGRERVATAWERTSAVFLWPFLCLHWNLYEIMKSWWNIMKYHDVFDTFQHTFSISVRICQYFDSKAINPALINSSCTCSVAFDLMIDVQQLRRSPKGKALWSARGIGLTNHWPIIDQSLIDFVASQQMQTWRDPAECPGTAWSMATDCILCQTLWHYIQTLFIHSLHTLSTDSPTYIFILILSLSLCVSLFYTAYVSWAHLSMRCFKEHFFLLQEAQQRHQTTIRQQSFRCFNFALDYGHLAFLQDAPADTSIILHPCISLYIYTW